MVVELPNLGSNLANLPPLQAKLMLKNLPVLLLILPQLRVHIKRASIVRLPLVIPVTILWQIAQSIKQLLALLVQMRKLRDDLLLNVLLSHIVDSCVHRVLKQIRLQVVAVVLFAARISNFWSRCCCCCCGRSNAILGLSTAHFSGLAA